MKKINKNKKAMLAGRQGFSLIELMMAIAIISIMTTVSLVSMNSTREKKAVEVAGREVAAKLREMQNYALTGKGLTGTSLPCTYDFSWTDETPNYSAGGCVNPAQSYTLKNEVKFDNGGSVIFDVPFAVVTITTPDILLKRGSSSYHVCIYPSGVISESLNGCP